jgi:hypothetical protein
LQRYRSGIGGGYLRVDRLRELLVKGVRQLSQAEQDEVLGVLLGQVAPTARQTAPTDVGASQVTLGPIDPWHVDVPGGPGAGLNLRAAQPLGLLDSLGARLPGDPETELKVLPVRLPVADYERLRAFSREHGFSMAVIIRTLVERFLDERVPPPNSGTNS